jgi:putative ABC transport system permease protein
LGATIGLAVGIGGSYILSDFSGPRPGAAGNQVHIPPVFLSSDLLNVWTLSVILSLGAGLFPAWKASRLSPMQALRR